jgi:hypothetical protein
LAEEPLFIGSGFDDVLQAVLIAKSFVPTLLKLSPYLRNAGVFFLAC